MEDKDASYKEFFSFPEMVEDLLKGFVQGAWMQKLDFSTLEQIHGSYVTKTFRQQHDDVVWRIRWGEEWLYVYILIEFQAKTDRFMALRVMTYVGLLYQDLLKKKQLYKKRFLPPVLPIVLYNGKPRWRAPLDINDLIVPVKGGLECFQPHFSYLLIDEGVYIDSDLAELHNLTAALFRLEKSRDIETARKVIANLIAWLQLPGQKELRRSFTRWIYKVFIQTRHPNSNIPEIEDLEEARTMLSQNVVEWVEKWKQEGREDGRAELVRTMLDRGATMTELVRLTGLAPAEINELKRSPLTVKEPAATYHAKPQPKGKAPPRARNRPKRACDPVIPKN